MQVLFSNVGMVNKMAYDELKYEKDDQQIILAKEVPNFSVPAAAAPAAAPESAEQAVTSGGSGLEQDGPGSLSEQSGETVDSPMVGVVYLQPQPGADPYIQLGDTVKKGQVIVIIEAMKLMNEIQATKSGVVTEILVDNEEVVEYGQPLVRID
mgnify:CR=1 FL=1